MISARAQRDALATLRSPIRTTVWAPKRTEERLREPEERGPLKGTRLHDAEWVGLRSVARHTDESFEFVSRVEPHCLSVESNHASPSERTEGAGSAASPHLTSARRRCRARITENTLDPVPVRPLIALHSKVRAAPVIKSFRHIPRLRTCKPEERTRPAEQRNPAALLLCEACSA